MSAADRNSSGFENGSITVFLCLVLCVILSLVLACIYSARNSAGRAALSLAAEEGLFSLFSNYDPYLFEEYGLLFLDAGNSSGEFDMGSIVAESLDYANKVISPDVSLLGVSPEELYDIELTGADVTGYILATDSSYSALVEQINEIILLKVGVDFLDGLEESMDIYSEAIEEYSADSEDEVNSITERYEELKEEAEELSEASDAEQDGADDTDGGDVSEDGSVEVPEDFVNPIENINKLKKMGIMSFALPEGTELSSAKIDTSDTVSGRTLNQGMGLLPDEQSGVVDKLAVSEFAIRFFPNFSSDEDDEDGDILKYQAEYIIAGNSEDTANLKAVMNRLLLIRLGLNYAYLLTSAEKTAEIYEIAAIVSTILLMPQAVEIVAQIVRLLWAYAEGMMDVKSLLSGGKVPIFKDASTWQVSLSLFSAMDESTEPENDSKGLLYEEYLRLLMYMMSADDLIARTADMIEHNRRSEDEDFRLDTCISELEIEFQGSISANEVYITRGYSYNA